MLNRFSFVILAVAAVLILTSPLKTLSKGKGRAFPPKPKNISIVHKPRGFSAPASSVKEFRTDELVIRIYSRGFIQGNAAYLEVFDISRKKNIELRSVIFNNRGILFSKKTWGFRALIGINPDTSPGKKKLTVRYQSGNKKRDYSVLISIAKGSFKFYPHPMDLGNYSDVDYQLKPHIIRFIKKCSEKKQRAFSRNSPDLLRDVFSHPRNSHYITSPFWAKRLVMRYRKKGKKKIRFRNKVNIHRGLDFRGKTGEPVYSIADGTVAIAEEMYYEGNFIIIDHGNRIFSYYMHLSKFTVKAGDRIKAGDLIGRVGSTGLSTGSHLHLSLMIQGVQVNPLSILSLPVRK